MFSFVFFILSYLHEKKYSWCVVLFFSLILLVGIPLTVTFLAEKWLRVVKLSLLCFWSSHTSIRKLWCKNFLCFVILVPSYFYKKKLWLWFALCFSQLFSSEKSCDGVLGGIALTLTVFFGSLVNGYEIFNCFCFCFCLFPTTTTTIRKKLWWNLPRFFSFSTFIFFQCSCLSKQKEKKKKRETFMVSCVFLSLPFLCINLWCATITKATLQ